MVTCRNHCLILSGDGTAGQYDWQLGRKQSRYGGAADVPILKAQRIKTVAQRSLGIFSFSRRIPLGGGLSWIETGRKKVGVDLNWEIAPVDTTNPRRPTAKAFLAYM
jgi:hypothetical protein